MKISMKLGLAMACLSVITLGMFLSTWYVTNQKKHDSLVINLAGRQRMLSQKMTKEVIFFHAQELHMALGKPVDPDPEAIKKKVMNTVKIFKMTLEALINSGQSPLSLDLKTAKYAWIPATTGEPLKHLMSVKKLWLEFEQDIVDILGHTDKDDAHFSHMVTSSIPLLQEMNKAVVSLQKVSEKKVGTLIRIQFAGVLVILGILAFTLFMSVNIAASVSKVGNRLQDIAEGEGDLTHRLDQKGKDEVGTTARWFNVFVTKIGDMVREIHGSTSGLIDSSQTLLGISKDMSKGAGETAKKLTGVSSAVEEINETMGQITDSVATTSVNTNMVASASEEMTATITEIAKNTERAHTITTQGLERVSSSTEKITILSDSARNIGQVSQVITEISEQTNLLALNATIEASRAGDAGKGFAVVANEIKDLASQTSESAREIKDQIQAIQSSAGDTAGEVEEMSTVIRQINEIVSGITAAVEEQSVTTAEITKNIAQASDMISQVNDHVSKTAGVIQTITTDINEVNQESEQVSSSSSKVDENSENVMALATQLNELVGRFKV
ncbi:MAG: methyl-accepting chemotaxis protein [Desulfobacterales bacterium]|nr:methyl-accepting chemotaxis protein [Desulfobacterales bacterium]